MGGGASVDKYKEGLGAARVGGQGGGPYVRRRKVEVPEGEAESLGLGGRRRVEVPEGEAESFRLGGQQQCWRSRLWFEAYKAALILEINYLS